MCETIFVKFGRIVLIVLNVIFVLFGLGLLIPAILMMTAVNIVTDDTKALMDNIALGGFTLSSALNILPWIMIILGAAILIIGLIGCIGACCHVKCLLVTYAIIMFIFALIVLAVAIVFFALGGVMDQFLKDELLKNLKKYSTDMEDKITNGWNYVFIEFECCGVNPQTTTNNDFTASPWGQANANKIPWSCCRSNTDLKTATQTVTGCTDQTLATISSSVYWTEGCYVKLKNTLTTYTLLLGIIAVCVFFLQVLLGIFALCLCKKKKDEYV